VSAKIIHVVLLDLSGKTGRRSEPLVTASLWDSEFTEVVFCTDFAAEAGRAIFLKGMLDGDDAGSTKVSVGCPLRAGIELLRRARFIGRSVRVGHRCADLNCRVGTGGLPGKISDKAESLAAWSSRGH
jgi:hypothetical protein